MSFLEIYALELLVVMGLMTMFLLRVSGVTLLEKSLAVRPGYEEYIKTTSSFIPWFPRKKG